MGSGMAAHLLHSGFPVIGHDIYAPNLRKFLRSESGSATSAESSPFELAKGADVMIVMVANQQQVSSLLFDAVDGAVAGLKRGAVVIVCSTVSPDYIIEVSNRLKGEIGREDVGLIDCPVSGGVGRAKDGTLSLFSSSSSSASSSSDDYDGNNPLFAPHIQSILSCLSDTDKLYHVPGGLGMGSKTKLIHQIFAGVHIAVASEVMGLAAMAGLDTQAVYEEVRKGEGDSWMFGNRVDHMLDPGGKYSAISIISKDVGIVMETARREMFPLPMVAVAEQLFLSAVASGWAGEDDWVVVWLYLGGRSGLVGERAGRPDLGKGVGSGISVSEIRDLLVGVHLAVLSEAMGFCEVLGIDPSLMFDIVSNAAGASMVFERYFGHLKENGWGLKGVKGIGEVRDRLVSFSTYF